MNGLLKPLTELEGFQTVLSAVRAKKTPVFATGVMDAQKAHLAAGLLTELDRPGVIITHSELQAKEISEDLQFFLNQRVMLYPSKDILFYSADVRSVNILKQRLAVLDALANGERIMLVMSAEALVDRLTPMDDFQRHIFTLQVADEISIDTLSRRLVLMGYERAELVEGAGQFAVRGGIIDIFTGLNDNAVRIEFWGDEVDSIRLLDQESQRSVEKLDSVRIFPMRELVYEDGVVEKALTAMENDYNKQLKACKEYPEAAANLTQMYDYTAERLKETRSVAGIDRLINYFYPGSESILDYLPKNTILFFDEPQRVSAHVGAALTEFGESVKNRVEHGQMLTGQMNMVFSYADVLHSAARFSTVLFSMLTHTIKDFVIKEVAGFSVKSTATFRERLDLLLEDLNYFCANRYRVLLLAGGGLRGKRIADDISERGITARYLEDLSAEELVPGVVTVTRGSISKSFEYQHIGMVVISDRETFGGERRRHTAKKKKGSKIESFTDLKVGDYVVHDNHGIGIYKGIEQIMVDDNVSRDYLKLQYADGGNLYIHTSQMDMIQKYIGGEDVRIKVNKLGGGEWNRAKAKAKKVVQEMAGELIELYAARQAAKGFCYSADTVWQREFEDMFAFDETEDQLTAIDEVKRDMESDKVMDRLICGDVGYGKTEVAIRAAFKAVQDGKQVAYLVPTTILAQQHYNTFVQRMKDFPINVSMMSRFRTVKQNNLSIEGLKNGSIDIVIGTHKILSKSVQFKNLGLIIVDEEQRFGVGHKEKLKKIRENVDVMTLTATPIPRTLHMSLTGIRDMSVLEEPPQERKPIQTYVMEFEPELVREAINRELARDGQVYYLHNRVHNISETAAKIQRLVPDTTVAYAHGQMSERELENIMMDFIEGHIKVLVCTTIIETGLDISNVNTIIIEDADTMGLAQLYQLRGRVGRSNRLAYAYLMYRKNKVLHEIAEKRLQTIRDFTEFGSGFKIAMRDLEIRGAGNLLGGEQHGHIEAVGYDMYCKLLEEAISEMRGDIVAESFETTIDININAFIPAYYIRSEEQKLEIYKKISLIASNQDYFDVQEEIEDRYGNLPEAVQNLLDISLLKAHAHRLGVVSVTQKDKAIVMAFKTDANVDPRAIMEAVAQHSEKLSFALKGGPSLTYKINDGGNISYLMDLKGLLEGI